MFFRVYMAYVLHTNVCAECMCGMEAFLIWH